VGKSGVLEHKTGNSLKRVKIEEKIQWRAHRKSQTLFEPWAIPDHGLPFRKIGRSQPHPKTAIAIISGTGKATNFKFCTHIPSIDRNKSPLQISGKV